MITWTHNGVTVGDEEGIVNRQESNDSTSVSARIDSGLHASNFGVSVCMLLCTVFPPVLPY